MLVAVRISGSLSFAHLYMKVTSRYADTRSVCKIMQIIALKLLPKTFSPFVHLWNTRCGSRALDRDISNGEKDAPDEIYFIL